MTERKNVTSHLYPVVKVVPGEVDTLDATNDIVSVNLKVNPSLRTDIWVFLLYQSAQNNKIFFCFLFLIVPTRIGLKIQNRKGS